MRRALVSALAAGALIAACSGGGAATTDLTSADSGTTVKGDVDDTFVLVLEENPSTGYTWEITEEPDAGVVRKVSSEFSPGSQGMAGEGGDREWRFKAYGSGTTTLSMEYRRPFGDEGAADTFTVTFDIG